MIDKIKNLKEPKNVTDVKSIIGTMQYIRKMIPYFSYKLRNMKVANLLIEANQGTTKYINAVITRNDPFKEIKRAQSNDPQTAYLLAELERGERPLGFELDRAKAVTSNSTAATAKFIMNDLVGDEVLVKEVSQGPRGANKFPPKYRGPFEVLVVNDNNTIETTDTLHPLVALIK
ncbi:hypothetical protein BLOT_009321, partial [Blomia tropicalis]